MMQTSHAAESEWRANWTLVLAASAGFSFMSLLTTSTGAFIGPLVKEFGWSRTVVSLGLPISGLVAILGPLIGVFIDRRGSRPLAIPGTFALMLSIAAFGLANGSVLQWAGLWLIASFASLAVTTNVWTAAVARAFVAGRGLALGLTLTGTAVAQAVTPVLATWLIERFGWRAAYPLMGLGWGSVTFVLCLLFFREPADRIGRPKEKQDTSGLPGLTIAQAWRDPGLWRIAISTFILMILTLGLLVHQIPILMEAGVSASNAALLAGAGGLAGIVGKLVTGVLVDRFRANWVGGITLGFTAFAFLLLMDGIRTPVLIVAAIIINGYAAGTKLQICSYLTSRYGGLRNFGTIFGFIGALISLGSALGPLLAGVIYDLTGGYDPFLLAGTIGCLFCGLLIITLPRYPDWSETRAVAGNAVPAPAAA